MKNKGKRTKKVTKTTITKRQRYIKKTQQKRTKTKTKKIDERPPFHIIINGKHAIYFLFLKRFIYIPFVKTVQCISF